MQNIPLDSLSLLPYLPHLLLTTHWCAWLGRAGAAAHGHTNGERSQCPQWSFVHPYHDVIHSRPPHLLQPKHWARPNQTRFLPPPGRSLFPLLSRMFLVGRRLCPIRFHLRNPGRWERAHQSVWMGSIIPRYILLLSLHMHIRVWYNSWVVFIFLLSIYFDWNFIGLHPFILHGLTSGKRVLLLFLIQCSAIACNHICSNITFGLHGR